MKDNNTMQRNSFGETKHLDTSQTEGDECVIMPIIGSKIQGQQDVMESKDLFGQY